MAKLFFGVGLMNAKIVTLTTGEETEVPTPARVTYQTAQKHERQIDTKQLRLDAGIVIRFRFVCDERRPHTLPYLWKRKS